MRKLEGCSNYQFQIMDYPKNNQFNNYIISKYLLPIAIFGQHSIQCTYPSNLLSKKGERKKLIAPRLPIFILSPTVLLEVGSPTMQ